MCILHFTYSFPPILYFGYKIKRDTLRYLGLAPMSNHSPPGKPNTQPAIPGAETASPPPEYEDKEKKEDDGVLGTDNQGNGLQHSTTNHHHVQWRHSGHITRDQRRAALKKALIKGFPVLAWLMIYFLGALVTSGLGSYSAIETLIAAFQVSSITSFTCHSPLDA